MGGSAVSVYNDTPSYNCTKWTAEHNNLMMVEHNNLTRAAGALPLCVFIPALPLAVVPCESLLSLLGAVPLAEVLVPLQGTDTVSLRCHELLLSYTTG